MNNPSRLTYEAIELGPLPAAKINALLQTDLEPGHVRLSRAAHRHMAEKHPEHYQICIDALALAISSPTFIGQGSSNRNNFEMIRRLKRADGMEVLVAIGLEPTSDGFYRVVSSYLISKETVEKRRQAKRLRPAPP